MKHRLLTDLFLALIIITGFFGLLTLVVIYEDDETVDLYIP